MGSSLPAHLTEFGPFVQRHVKSESLSSENQLHSSPSTPVGGLQRRLSQVSLSNTSIASNTTFSGYANAHPDLPAVITSKDISSIIGTFGSALDAATKYKSAIQAVAVAAAEFGAAIEACSHAKGAGDSSEGLLDASGLHYLIANHHQILAHSLETVFEAPLQKQIQIFKDTAISNEKEFKQQLKEKTQVLKQLEKKNSKLSHARVRNLASYRSSLVDITSQIDAIDHLKYEYFHSAYELAQNTSAKVLAQTATAVRAEVEIFEGIARKGWSGGGLESLIASCADPFTQDDLDEGDHEDGGAGLEISSYKEDFSPASTSQESSPTPTDNGTIRAGKKPPTEHDGGPGSNGRSNSIFGTNDLSPVKTEIFSVLPQRSILPELSNSEGGSDDDHDNDYDRATIEGNGGHDHDQHSVHSSSNIW